MITKSKSKFYLLIIAILALANIALLYFLLNANTKHEKKKSGWAAHDAAARVFLQNNIGFDSKQLVLFDTMVKQHRIKMKMLLDKNKKDKETQLKQLGNKAFSDSAIDSAILINAENQKSVNTQLYEYLKSLRSICTPEQVVKYDTSFYKMWNKKKE